MKYIFSILILLHGAIHLIGFLKAYKLAQIDQLNADISRTSGIVWLLAFILFLASGISYLVKVDWWYIIAFIAITISTYLIIMIWQDTKFGMIANIIILIVSFIGFQTRSFENKYRTDFIEGIERTISTEEEILTGEDIQHLPDLVQRYIEYTGALNKPRVKNVKVSFVAEMRGRNQEWFTLTAEQNNFYDVPERFFFLKAKVKGLPTRGYHMYKGEKSIMTIKLFSIIPVVEVSGNEIFEAETVTFFNDMCFLAPATLTDKRISWEEVDDKSVKATFHNYNTAISAILYFNNQGQLVNFESCDRYDVNEMKKYKFSTPLKKYKSINGFNLANYGEAIWHYPEGDFVYGRYSLKDIQYNVTDY